MTPKPPVDAEVSRIHSLDVLRGVAVLGILVLNIVSFGLPAAYENPALYGGHEGWNLGAYVLSNVFVEGVMRGIFTALFGASVILISDKLTTKQGAVSAVDHFLRRNIWLFIFGLINAWGLLWYGDVLYWYALAGFFVYPLRHLTPKTLTILGLSIVATLIPRTGLRVLETEQARAVALEVQELIARGGTPTLAQQETAQLWLDIQSWLSMDAAQIAAKIEALRGDYVSVFRTLAPLIQEFETTIAYEGGVFDAMGFMLLGMALFKLGVLTGRRSHRFYWVTGVLSTAFGVAINVLEMVFILESDFDPVTILKWGYLGLTYDLSRIPLTLGYICLIVLACKTAAFPRIAGALSAVGRLALTNYMMQSLLCAFVFYGFGLGLYGELQRHQLYYVVAVIWVIQVLFSVVWLRHFRWGPAEWIWRQLTQWQFIPNRKSAIPIPSP